MPSLIKLRSIHLIPHSFYKENLVIYNFILCNIALESFYNECTDRIKVQRVYNALIFGRLRNIFTSFGIVMIIFLSLIYIFFPWPLNYIQSHNPWFKSCIKKAQPHWRLFTNFILNKNTLFVVSTTSIYKSNEFSFDFLIYGINNFGIKLKYVMSLFSFCFSGL